MRMTLFAAVLILATAVMATADPWATEVVSYAPGSNASAGYTDPSAALGSPRRTMPGDGGGDLTPFNGEWHTGEVVSIGCDGIPGHYGELVVKFDHQVMDNPIGTQYGIDFIVFGNAFYSDAGGGTVGWCSSEPAYIGVSQNGTDWRPVSGVWADTEFPTMGYTDTTGPYAADGIIETDYTQAVDPAFSASGCTLAQLQAGYGGAGGGTGVDISGTGLDWIQYVRVYQYSGAACDIDAFADVVPEPATMVLLSLGGLAMAAVRRRRRR